MENKRSILKRTATEFRQKAYVPYSGIPVSAVVLLSDGMIVPGVRVENASFSLTISAVQNALTTAAMLCTESTAIVAVYSDSVTKHDLPASISEIAGCKLTKQDDHYFTVPDLLLDTNELKVYDPFILFGSEPDAIEHLNTTRAITGSAHTPESDFPVGCLLVTGDGRGIVGVNVEVSDWNDILCAERNALGTAVTFGATDIQTIYVSAPKDPFASPCGACRQVMVELAQQAMVWMDRGKNPPLGEPCTALLPYFFSGNTIPAANRHS